MGMGSILEAAPVGFLEILSGDVASSTNVFHSLQFGHLPTQRGETYPHDWQTYFVWTLAMDENTEKGGAEAALGTILLPGQYSNAAAEIQQS
jgi:hypothetical protein